MPRSGVTHKPEIRVLQDDFVRVYIGVCEGFTGFYGV